MTIKSHRSWEVTHNSEMVHDFENTWEVGL